MPPRSDELQLQILQELRKEVGEMRVEMGVMKAQMSIRSGDAKGIVSVLGSIFGGVAVVWVSKVMHW